MFGIEIAMAAAMAATSTTATSAISAANPDKYFKIITTPEPEEDDASTSFLWGTFLGYVLGQ
jgi:hypothetical protein